jgi:hypothetical protein
MSLTARVPVAWNLIAKYMIKSGIHRTRIRLIEKFISKMVWILINLKEFLKCVLHRWKLRFSESPKGRSSRVMQYLVYDLNTFIRISAIRQKINNPIVHGHVMPSTMVNLKAIKKNTTGEVTIDMALNSNIGKKSLSHFLSACLIHCFSWR